MTLSDQAASLRDRIAWGFCLLLASAPSFLVAVLAEIAKR